MMGLSCSARFPNWTTFGVLATLLVASDGSAVADERRADGPKSQAVLAKLQTKIDFDFPEMTPLWDVVNYMSVASQGPRDDGFKFDFDDDGLKEIGKTRHSPIPVALKGNDVSIEDQLNKALRAMGLIYTVKEGVLLIGMEPAETAKPRP